MTRLILTINLLCGHNDDLADVARILVVVNDQADMRLGKMRGLDAMNAVKIIRGDV